jgi:hypothetical protein
MIIGDAEIWADTFPEELIPRMLNLVLSTWEPFAKPGPSDLEVPITQRFKHSLKQAKDFQRLPVRIEREPAEDHPQSGQELGRIDLKFLPAVSAREEIYFAFECKRLNVSVNGTRRTLAAEYVTQGMMRFVTGQYASSVQNGGMIGYVLDGKGDEAITSVDQNIQARRAELRIATAEGLKPSTVQPSNRLVRETDHSLVARPAFRLHHIFLECGLPGGKAQSA